MFFCGLDLDAGLFIEGRIRIQSISTGSAALLTPHKIKHHAKFKCLLIEYCNLTYTPKHGQNCIASEKN